MSPSSSTTMDHPPRDQTPLHASSFQGRALHFLKRLASHARGTGASSSDTHDVRRTRASVDCLRKPHVTSRRVGFSADDTSPMDTDDASASSNSPRRHSTDSLRTAPVLRDPPSCLPTPRSPDLLPHPGPKPDEEAVHTTQADHTLRRLGVHDAALTTSLLLPEPRSAPDPQHAPVPSLSRHAALSPPPFRLTTARGLRPSPSIMTRQPVPLLSLPPLPPPAPDTSRQRVPLRSMPSLSRHGRSGMESESATLGDSESGEEEEEPTDALDVRQSDDDDDDDDDDTSSVAPSDAQGFESSQKQRTRELAKSPVAPTPPDGSCSKTDVKPIASSTSLTMYSFPPNIPSSEHVHALDPDRQTLGPRLEPRPSAFHSASRSMINLGPSWRAQLGLHPLSSGETVRSVGPAPESAVESEESNDTDAVIGRLLRRTSMPSYQPTSDPPPYPTFDPRPKESRVTPHDSEESEWLPPYSNSLYLLAIMPRKMEFSCPGVQARDRKWRRVVCELEGTTLRVYKCPPGASGAGALGDWWEKHVGVGDVASPRPPRTQKKEEPIECPAKPGVDEPSTLVTLPASSGRSTSVPPVRHSRGRSESQSSMATQSTRTFTPRPAKRTSGASFLSPFRSSNAARPEATTEEPWRRPESRELELLPVDVQSTRSSLSHEPPGRATRTVQRWSLPPPPPRSAPRLGFLPSRVPWRNDEIPKPPKSDLLRAYTLQHAESGLGTDYLKRKNVIRVRLEGEQFLLQAPDVPAVVEWIEGLHAGTNIALDIDQRPMPRGPMFPRRRRRRTRRSEDASGQRPFAPRIAA